MGRILCALLVLLTGCVRNLSMLEPRPNLPPAREPSVNLVLANAITQEQRLFRLQFSTFRGDLKRGFFNGYPGAVESGGSITIALDSVEPSYERTDSGECHASLRYRGRFLRGGQMLDAFAATAESSPSDIKLCFKRAIETMYEQLYASQGDLP